MPRWTNHERKNEPLAQPVRDKYGKRRCVYFGKLTAEADRLAAGSTVPGQTPRERVSQVTRAAAAQLAPSVGHMIYSVAVREKALQMLRSSFRKEIAAATQEVLDEKEFIENRGFLSADEIYFQNNPDTV